MANHRINQFNSATNPAPGDYVAGYQTDSVKYTVSQLQSAGKQSITSATDIVLTNPLKSLYQVNFTTSGKKVILSPANQSNSITPGSKLVISVIGSNSCDVYLADGTTQIIGTLRPSRNAVLYCTDNSTSNGTWISNVVGTLGQQEANNVVITGGSITGTNALDKNNNLTDLSSIPQSRYNIFLNPSSNRIFMGGDVGVSNPIQHNQWIYVFTNSSGANKLILPPMNASDSIPINGIFYIENLSDTLFGVVCQDGVTGITTINPGECLIFKLYTNDTANGTFTIRKWGTLSELDTSDVLQAANNLSDVADAKTSRSNLSLNPESQSISMSGDFTLTNPLQQNEWIYISTNTSSANKLILPAMNAASSIPLYGMFYIQNDSTTSFDVYSNDGTTSWGTVSPSQCQVFKLVDDNTANGLFTIRTWGSLSTQNADGVAITGGNIDNTTIGQTTPAYGQLVTPLNTHSSAYAVDTLLYADSMNLLNGTFNVTLVQRSTLALPRGFSFDFKNVGSGTITFVTQGSDTIRNNVSILPGASGKIVLSVAGTPNTWDMLVGTIPTGRQSLFIPSSGFYSAITNGAVISQIESTTNKNNIRGFAFDPSTTQYTTFSFSLPKKWDKGTITYQLYAVANATSGAAIFDLQGVCRNAGDAFDLAYGTAQSVTVTASGTAYNMLVSSESSAITLAGTINNNCEIELRLWRDAANAGDTLTVNAIVVGIKVFYTVNEANDA